MIPKKLIDGLGLTPENHKRLTNALEQERRLCRAAIRSGIYPALAAGLIDSVDSSTLKDDEDLLIEKIRVEFK